MQAGLNLAMSRTLETLGQRLQHARKMRHLRQVGLAKAAGVKQSDISKLETGRSYATTAIARLSHALRVPVRWLELGEGPEPTWDEAPPDGERPEEPAAVQADKQLTQEEIQLLEDFRELLPEQRLPLLLKLREQADQMRAHTELVLKRAGVRSSATDERAEQRQEPGPAWGERRQQNIPVENERRESWLREDRNDIHQRRME